MASWVLSISEDFPQHWGYAVRHGMWDLRKHRDIRAGDLIYFDPPQIRRNSHTPHLPPSESASRSARKVG